MTLPFVDLTVEDSTSYTSSLCTCTHDRSPSWEMANFLRNSPVSLGIHRAIQEQSMHSRLLREAAISLSHGAIAVPCAMLPSLTPTLHTQHIEEAR